MTLRHLVLIVALVLAWGVRAEATSCTVSTTAVNFGSYNVFDPTPTDSTGTIVYRCNSSVDTIWITISRGGASFLPRRMTKGSDQLTYNLYMNASRTIVWGDFSGGTLAYYDNNAPNNKNVELTVYGRVTAQQDVSAGSYRDTVTVTVNY